MVVDFYLTLLPPTFGASKTSDLQVHTTFASASSFAVDYYNAAHTRAFFTPALGARTHAVRQAHTAVARRTRTGTTVPILPQYLRCPLSRPPSWLPALDPKRPPFDTHRERH